MSKIVVEVVRVDNIYTHPNADRLELAMVGGWQVVVQKGAFKTGDPAVYFPIDSVLPKELDDKLFGPDSKIQLEKGRVRTIKLRGEVSQGLLVPVEELGIAPQGLFLGQDLTQMLGVTKLEPAVGSAYQRFPDGGREDFPKYTDIQHIQGMLRAFSGRGVLIEEKIHGRNFRCGYVRRRPRGRFDALLQKLRLAGRWEFVYGSHNVELPNCWLLDPDTQDPYARVVRECDLMNKLRPGEILYGEIYGPKMQKGYSYGIPPGYLGLVVIDVMQGGKFLAPGVRDRWCDAREFQVPPHLYAGPLVMRMVKALASGPSVLCKDQPIMEGVVVRTFDGGPRQVAKYLNPDYLLQKGNSEHH